AVVVAGRPVDELKDILRNAEVLEHGAYHALHRRERGDAIEDGRGDEPEHPSIDAHGHLGRMRGSGEDVEHFTDAVRCRIREVETLAIETLFVCEIVKRIRHEVDWHEVDASALDTDRRHPCGDHPPHLLDQLEEVVRPVDLVDVTGLRMTDDEAGPVHAPGPLALLADNALRKMLGL